MLEFLHIRNLALIEDMSLEFTDGINVLTGETGAGKSFILKALNFVLGEKLAADIVRPGAEKAQVEAIFRFGEKELVLRRELAAASGRSRFYINDSLHSQDALRAMRDQLISHTSQHAQQKLLQPAFQTALLEKEFAKPELLAKKEELLEKLKNVSAKIGELEASRAQLAEKRELLEMQSQEIEKVAPAEGEEEELESQRAAARQEEGQRENYANAMSLLHGEDGPGIIQLLAEFERVLSQMARIDASLAPEVENVAALRQNLTHLGNQFRRPPGSRQKVDMDAIESRLFAFAQLKRKLKRTMPQILALKEEIANNLSFLDMCALDISSLNKEKNRYVQELEAIVEEIKPLRRKAARQFADKLEAQLRELGFSEHVRIEPDFVKQQIWPGVDDERGRIFWAPNPGQKAQALDRIASGGELSRFLLGLTTLGQDNNDLTYIFDEVDAGVGGLTLNKVGEKLQNLASSHQLILITHWPQLAARAKSHFQITKTVSDDNTYTKCHPLNGDERKAELARMAGGGPEGMALAASLI